jgi:hypothetical protein
MALPVNHEAQNYVKLSAVHYATRLGWAVFPLASGTKVPLKDSHGFNDATTDPGAIWQWPDTTGLGTATGSVSGLLVADVDPRHGASLDGLYEMMGGPVETPMARTGGGGFHLFFKHPGWEVTSKADALGRGYDIRADRAYVVAAPSLHESGNRYRWLISPFDVAVAEAPARLLDLLAAQNFPIPELAGDPEGWTAIPGMAGYWLKWALDRAHVGNRHDTANRLARQLRDNRVPYAEALFTLRRFAAAVSTPDHPFSEAGATKILDWHYATAPRLPSRVSLATLPVAVAPAPSVRKSEISGPANCVGPVQLLSASGGGEGEEKPPPSPPPPPPLPPPPPPPPLLPTISLTYLLLLVLSPHLPCIRMQTYPTQTTSRKPP